jgi:hypothetical protein
LAPPLNFIGWIIGSGLGYGDGSRGTDLDAALTAETFIFINGDCFFVLHLEDASRTNIDAFFVPGALIMINFYPPRHSVYLLELI